MKVLADEAHGTHLYFGKDLPVSGMAAGADLAAVSMSQIRRKPDAELYFACEQGNECGLCEADHQPDADNECIVPAAVKP